MNFLKVNSPYFVISLMCFSGNTDLCKWCLINPKELAAYPCYHLAICRPCAQLTNSCPMCGIEAEAFFKLYM